MQLPRSAATARTYALADPAGRPLGRVDAPLVTPVPMRGGATVLLRRDPTPQARAS